MKLRRFFIPMRFSLNKLKYPQQFGLISLLFILPLAVVVLLLVGELNTRIDVFGQQEMYGARYLRSLRELLENAQQHRRLSFEQLSRGDNIPNQALLTLEAQIEQDFEALDRVDRQYGVLLETTERVKRLKDDWRDLKAEALNLKAEESYRRQTQFIAAIRGLMSHVGDTSYLILDPELDSYYMMDTVLLKLPEAQELIAQSLLVGEGEVSRHGLTPEEKAQLIILTSRIESNLETMKSNVNTALANNSAQNLKLLITIPFEENIRATEQYLAAPVFKTSGDKALHASFEFYDAASPALETLLQARIDSLTRREYFIMAFVLGSIGLAFLLGLSVMRAISRPLSDLVEATRRLGLGDYSTRLAAGEDEIGQVGDAFNRMTEELQGSQQRMAGHVHRLEIVATLGERLNAILNLEELLAEVVNQIQARFGYYHAHIYLVDDDRKNLVVTAGTGPAGAEMKAKRHHIPLEAITSLVARAARGGQIVRVDNVREADDWLPNSLLPDTYSEMAVPIIVEDKVVGVLDVQENKLAGLDEGDAALLRSLANQVAIAMRNARQFEKVEASLAEAHETQQRYMEQAWNKNQALRHDVGRVQFSLGESRTLSETALLEARRQALAHKSPAVVTVNGGVSSETSQPITGNDSSKLYALVAPITLGETIIGNLQLHGVDPARQWNESDLALINAIIDQVAQTAENLRLLNETQERASREQFISQVSDKLRRAPDMQALMKVATEEISRALNPARTFIRFDTKTIVNTSQNLSAETKNGGNQP